MRAFRNSPPFLHIEPPFSSLGRTRLVGTWTSIFMKVRSSRPLSVFFIGLNLLRR